MDRQYVKLLSILFLVISLTISACGIDLEKNTYFKDVDDEYELSEYRICTQNFKLYDFDEKENTDLTDENYLFNEESINNMSTEITNEALLNQDIQSTTEVNTVNEVDTIGATSSNSIEQTVSNLTDSINSQFYGYMEVENTGTTDLYLHYCKFNVQDAIGREVKAQYKLGVYPKVIKPGEKGYFYIENGTGVLDDEYNESLGFKVDVSDIDIIKYSNTFEDLTIDKDKLKKMDIMSELTLTMNNTKINNTEDKNCVQCGALLYNKDNELIAIASEDKDIKDFDGEKKKTNLSILYGLNEQITTNIDHYDARIIAYNNLEKDKE